MMSTRPATTLPTIDDVAAAAGVSSATVSRALNQPQAVREALRQRVLDAVAQLGYVPHAGARALMLGKTGTFGAIVPTVDNAIFAQAIDAMQRRLAQDGQQLLIATSGYDPEAEMRQAVNLVTRGADGLALLGLAQRPQLLGFLRQRGLPCVHALAWPDDDARASAGGEAPICVGFDNARAIGQAVRYLVGLGHRRIAMLAGVTRDNDRAAARVAGVRRALHEAGLALRPEHLVEQPYGLAPAREGLRALLAAAPAPTAVLCGNDVLAFGALLEAQRLGIQVPQALSIVGFDDLELARHLQPALTTLRVPSETLWRLVAERLLDAVRGIAVPRRTEVEVELVVRESTGPVSRR